MKGPSVLTLVTLLMMTSLAVVAQEIGDEVRVRPSEDAVWQVGRLLNFPADSELVLQPELAEASARYSVAELQRADYYDSNHPVWPIMGGVVGFVAGTLIWWPCGEEVAFLESNCVTGSEAGDVALSIGVGALVGGAIYLLNRGDWKIWVEDGRLKR